MNIELDHLKESQRRKVEKTISEYIEAVTVFSQHGLAGNVSVLTHVSDGAIMKSEINYNYCIRLK